MLTPEACAQIELAPRPAPS